MDGFTRVAKLRELPPGRMLPVRVGDADVLLYNVGGRIHATRDRCTHQSFPLSKGVLRGKYVKCAFHGWEYDVTNGAYQGNPGIHVRCFEVRVEGDDIWVRSEAERDYNGPMRRDHPMLNVDPYRDLLEEVAPLRGLSTEETARMLSAVCASARSIADSRPDRDDTLAWQPPLPAASIELWARLRSERAYRGPE